jgi:hypothetical protein
LFTHAPPSEVHIANSQTFPIQLDEQQSAGPTQAAPTPRHIPAPVEPTVVKPAMVLVPVEPVAWLPPIPVPVDVVAPPCPVPVVEVPVVPVELELPEQA